MKKSPSSEGDFLFGDLSAQWLSRAGGVRRVRLARDTRRSELAKIATVELA